MLAAHQKRQARGEPQPANASVFRNSNDSVPGGNKLPSSLSSPAELCLAFRNKHQIVVIEPNQPTPDRLSAGAKHCDSAADQGFGQLYKRDGLQDGSKPNRLITSLHKKTLAFRPGEGQFNVSYLLHIANHA